MPRVQRSPPPDTSNKNELQALSDSDIPQLISGSPYDSVNITSRYKRTCPYTSPGSEFQEFKKEMQAMLLTWKNEQEEYLKKFCNDQISSLTKLGAEITEMKLQNLAIQKSNFEIEKTVTFISKQYDDMKKQIDVLQKEKQLARECIQNLETKVQDLQRSSRISSIEIRNVIAKESESPTELSAIVSKVGSVVDMTIDDTHIRDIYRLPGKQDTIRPIVVEFTKVHTKNQLLTAVRNFNKKNPNTDRLSTQNIGMAGERRPIYISEYLPPSSRKLMYAAKEFSKQNKYNFCWSSNGNIFLKKAEGDKQILVKSEQTLRELQVQVNQ